MISILTILLIIDVKKGIILSFLIRPITDTCWQPQFLILGFRPTEYVGVLLPTLVFLQMLFNKSTSFNRDIPSKLWILSIYFTLFNTMLIFAMGGGAKEGVNFFYRAFNGFMAYFLIKEFFNDQKIFRVLLLAILIASVFPMGMSVYQNLLGGAFRTRATVGGLVRNVGLYHDGFSLKLYSFQTLMAVLLYWSYFIRGRMFIARGFLILLGTSAIYTIYRIFTKSGFASIVLCFLAWNIVRKNYIVLAATIILTSTLFVIPGSPVLKQVETVFQKEIGALEGEVKLEHTLQGRWYGWQDMLKFWMDLPVLNKLIGDAHKRTGTHNDFLRVMMSGGIIGLAIYLLFIFSISYKVIKNTIHDNSPLNAMALSLLCMWIVDSMGATTGTYPGYLAFVWGFIGLSFRHIEGLEADQNSSLSTMMDRPKEFFYAS